MFKYTIKNNLLNEFDLLLCAVGISKDSDISMSESSCSPFAKSLRDELRNGGRLK